MNEIQRAVAAKQRRADEERRRHELEEKLHSSPLASYANGFSDTFAAWLDRFAERLAGQHGIEVIVTYIDGRQDAAIEPVNGEPCGSCHFEVSRTYFPDGRDSKGSARVPRCQAPVRASCEVDVAESVPPCCEHVWGLKLGGDQDRLFDEPQFWFHVHSFRVADVDEALHHFDSTAGFDQLRPGQVVVNVAKSQAAGRLSEAQERSLLQGIEENPSVTSAMERAQLLRNFGFCGHSHDTDHTCMARALDIFKPLTNFMFDPTAPEACNSFVERVLTGEKLRAQFDYLRLEAGREATERAKSRAEAARVEEKRQQEAERRQQDAMHQAELQARNDREQRRRTIVAILPGAVAIVGVLFGLAVTNPHASGGKIGGAVIYGIIGLIVGNVARRFVGR